MGGVRSGLHVRVLGSLISKMVEIPESWVSQSCSSCADISWWCPNRFTEKRGARQSQRCATLCWQYFYWEATFSVAICSVPFTTLCHEITSTASLAFLTSIALKPYHLLLKSYRHLKGTKLPEQGPYKTNAHKDSFTAAPFDFLFHWSIWGQAGTSNHPILAH